MQLVARALERAGVQAADAGVGGFQVHQVIEAVDQFTHCRLAAKQRESRDWLTHGATRAARANIACAAGAPGKSSSSS